MKHFTIAALAAALSLLALGSAQAAPKSAKLASGEKVCALGQGKYVCCKAGVADHCIYVSCCEQGNAAFFTKTDCQTCEAHVMEKAMHAASCADCGTSTGNSAFYTAGECSSGSCDTARAEKPAATSRAKK